MFRSLEGALTRILSDPRHREPMIWTNRPTFSPDGICDSTGNIDPGRPVWSIAKKGVRSTSSPLAP